MSEPQRYRKKPVVVEAMRYTGENLEAIADFIGEVPPNQSWGDVVYIVTLEGKMAAGPGDWIIRGVQGEFYPCKADIFDATYEPVAEGESR